MEKPKEIRIENIVCTADRDQGDITTLVASIKRLGLLQPIILQKIATEKYEVIDGRRRFAAIQQIGWRVLPESSFTFGPETENPLVMAHVANVERKQLTPAEEVKHLIELAKTHTGEQLAEIFGRTPGWIARRLKIADLIPEWLKVLDDPELSALWPLEKLALIARQPECTQKKILWMKGRGENFSTAAITETINEYNHQLSAAAFDIAECAKCRDNTATQELLFDDADAAGGVCLNKNCWIKKSLDKVKTILKEEKLIPIDGHAGYAEPDSEFAKKIKAKSEWEFEKVRAPKKGETANAIIVSGDEIGRRVFAVERKKTAVASALIEKKPPTIKEQQAVLKQRRNKKALTLLLETLQKKGFVTELAERMDCVDLRSRFMTCLYCWGYTGEYTGQYGFYKLDKKILDKVIDMDEFLEGEFYPQMVDKISEKIRHELTNTLDQINQNAGPVICTLFRLSWKDMFEKAAELVPEPKSLTEAKAKSTDSHAESER